MVSLYKAIDEVGSVGRKVTLGLSRCLKELFLRLPIFKLCIRNPCYFLNPVVHFKPKCTDLKDSLNLLPRYICKNIFLLYVFQSSWGGELKLQA